MALEMQASDSHLDLSRAPVVVYGVKYIDYPALTMQASDPHFDLSGAAYVLYGVKHNDQVSSRPISGYQSPGTRATSRTPSAQTTPEQSALLMSNATNNPTPEHDHNTGPHTQHTPHTASGSQLDLGRAPYGVYAVNI